MNIDLVWNFMNRIAFNQAVQLPSTISTYRFSTVLVSSFEKGTDYNRTSSLNHWTDFL